MSQHVIGHMKSSIPEFQLVSEHASCLFLDEIHGGYFLVYMKGRRFLLKSCLNLDKFILLVEWSLEVEDGLFMTGCVLDLFVVIRPVALVVSCCLKV